jgi:hypothetical protein
LNRPTPRPHRGIATQEIRRMGSPAMVDATSPTQPMAAVKTEPMEVSSVATVTVATSVRSHSFHLFFISFTTIPTITEKQISENNQNMGGVETKVTILLKIALQKAIISCMVIV